MAGGLLFVSQAMLDSWADQGKIDFVGNVMTLLQGEGKGRSYALEPAVRFMKVLGAESDPHALLAKVKTIAQLREMGADPAGDSVILGEVAYEVEPGFLAEVSALQAAAAAKKNPGVRADVAEIRAAVGPPLSLAPAEMAAKGARAAAAPPSPPARLPKELEEKRKEAEALARFLLENLS
jgi:hypothetical protein